jgi:hypothetical protein
MKISIDERSSSLIVAGSSDDLNVAEAILQKLDGQQHGTLILGGFEIRVIWLATGLTGENKGDPPADDLRDGVSELSRLGIKELRQVAQMVVQTVALSSDKGTFEVKSSPRFGDQVADFNASGTLSGLPGRDWMSLQIRIRTRKEPSPPDHNLNQVDTQIILPLNQYVVLATAPTGNQTSVFVVQVTLATKPGAKKAKP